jgi:hypothetical protein
VGAGYIAHAGVRAPLPGCEVVAGLAPQLSYVPTVRMKVITSSKRVSVDGCI